MKNTVHTIERSEEALINKNSDQTEKINSLTEENSKLSVLLELYNRILEEYQINFGNELFEDVQKTYEMTNDKDFESYKKILVNNFSLIKDYEVELLKKDKNINDLNQVIVNLTQKLEEKITHENEVRQEILEVKKEKEAIINEFMKSNNEGGNQLGSTFNNFNPKIESASNFYQAPYKTSTGFYKKTNNSLNQDNDLKQYSSLLEQQKFELLSYIENYKIELEKLKVICQSLNDKNVELQNDNDRLTKEYSVYKSENEDFQAMRDKMAAKFSNYNQELIRLESELDKQKNICENIKSGEDLLKKEIQFYKQNYDELETRKNNEIESLIREITNIRSNYNDSKNRIILLEEDNSILKFDLSKTKQELSVNRENINQLNKMLKATDSIVEKTIEKEKNLDLAIKSHKAKLDNALIDKEKCQLKVKLLEQQIQKLNSDYNKSSSERQEKYEQFIETIQSKYALINNKKEEDLQMLRNELLVLKIENDRLHNDYNLIKKEYDKLSNCLKEETEKYMKKYEQSEKNSLRVQESLIEKNSELNKKLEVLEHSKNLIEKDLKLLCDNDKNKEYIINKLSKVDDVKERENLKIKEKYELMLVEKEELEKELDRIKQMYESKIHNLKSQYEMKIGILDSTIKHKKGQYDESEEKAFELLKRQESVSLFKNNFIS
jgi:hypothetical protein